MAQSVEQLVDEVLAIMSSGGDLSAVLHDDVLMLGTDPGEWWEGRQEVLAAHAAQDAALGRPDLVPEGDLRVRERDGTGWFAGHVAVRFGQISVRLRMTGVAVRDDTGWAFVQLQAAPAMAPLPVG